MSMKIGLIGNCQVRTYAALLRQTDPDVSVEMMDFSDPSSRIEDNRRSFLDRMQHFDYVLCQDNGLSHTNFNDVASACGADKLVKICNFFFRGTFPDICYLGRFEGRIGYNDYNSVIILGSYLRGLSVEQCLAKFNKDTFHSLGLHRAWNDSLAELILRDAQLDCPGAPLAEEFTRHYPAFRTMNHPNDHLLSEYLGQILKRLGKPTHVRRTRPSDDPLYFIELPIHDFVAEELGLPYRTPQYLRIYNNFVNLETFVAENYKAYAKSDKAELIVNSPADLKQEIASHNPGWLTPG